mmetsp:Transcript_131749/g.281701  ORF Transcript_131749/g.281701 Transcript_131749/m.281701 type:complete len:336 (+) Transcript_131749:1137-2144(+)
MHQPVWGRTEAAPAPGRAEPAKWRQGLPFGPCADEGLQSATLQESQSGMPGVRLERLGPVQRLLRPLAQQVLHPDVSRWWQGLRHGAVRGPGLHGHTSGLQRSRLRLGRLVRLGRLHLLLWRRPADARPPHRQGSTPRGQALRGEQQGGSTAVQHTTLRPAGGLQGRRVGGLERVGGVLCYLRGRHDLALAAGPDGGQRVRQASPWPHEGAQELQCRRPVRTSCGLPVQRVDGLERLYQRVRRCQATVPKHSCSRARQGKVLRGAVKGDFALPRKLWPGFSEARGLRSQRVAGLGSLQRALWTRREDAIPANTRRGRPWRPRVQSCPHAGDAMHV